MAEYDSIGTPEIAEEKRAIQSPLELEPLTRRHLRVVHELGHRSTMLFEGYTLLDTPEVSNRRLEKFLEDNLVGQGPAIKSLLDAIDRSEVRLEDDPRPKAALAFLGPTGVGKSQLAKLLAKYYSPDNPRLIKIDCSDFSQGHEVSTLTGSPPGYVDSDKTGRLSKKNVERYGTVVLFDELEKGHAKLHDLLLQILGDGQLVMKDGSVTNFRDAVIVLTSNLGAEQIVEHLSKKRTGFTVEGQAEPDQHFIEQRATEAFKKSFRPEFVNRLDGMVVFSPLDDGEFVDVLNLNLSNTNQSYAERYGMAITLTDRTKESLVQKAQTDRSMGVRPLLRAFEQDILVPFGRHVKRGDLTQGARVKVFHREELDEEHRKKVQSEFIFGWEHDPDLWELREEIKREEQRIEDERAAEARRRAEMEREKRAIEASRDDDGDRPDSDDSTPGDDAEEA